MNSHLSDNQITEWMLGTRDETVCCHLASCPACSLQAKELQSSLAGFHDAVHATAQHDPGFWRNQQSAILERAYAKDWYPLHWAWAVAMVLVLIAALFLARTPTAPQNYLNEDADNALLQAVQGDLKREVPEALAPAVLIAEERNEILTHQAARATQTAPAMTKDASPYTEKRR